MARMIPGHLCYAVALDGRIFSRARIGFRIGEIPWRELKQATQKNGYRTVSLGKNNAHFIHRLIAQAFIGPQYLGMQVRHLDGDPSNNNLSNLAYGTAKQNAEDMIAHGRSMRGRKQHLNKLDEKQVLEVRLLAEGREIPQRAIAKNYGISQTTVRDIMTRKSWGWLE